MYLYLLDEFLLFLFGNSFSEVPATPEVIVIAPNNTYDELESMSRDLKIYNDLWNVPKFGMVGSILNGTVFICGGTDQMSNGQQISINDCQTFIFDNYSWVTWQNISMLENRAFAQLSHLQNGSMLIMGGETAPGESLYSTEQLDGSMSFSHGISLPERLSKHCATTINSSHIFLSGGRAHIVFSRGKIFFL